VDEGREREEQSCTLSVELACNLIFCWILVQNRVFNFVIKTSNAMIETCFRS